MADPLVLHEDRFFDSDPAVRRTARAIYDDTRHLPLVCPHGHVDAALLAGNAPFPEPTALLITPDHYIFRLLYSRGMSMEQLGIPTRDGTPVETDARVIWQRFADNYYLFRGTPTGVWLDHEMYEVFGVRQKLTGDTAQAIYDRIASQLETDTFRPRALFDRFDIEVLTTTDAASDPLVHHQAIRNDPTWDGNVIPTFRPDAVFRIATPGWRTALGALQEAHGNELGTYAAFLRALEERRQFFKSMGAAATDHAVIDPYTGVLAAAELEGLSRKRAVARRRPATSAASRATCSSRWRACPSRTVS